MTRLARYLKPYIGFVIAVVALLFVQANADLALPDYMSRIVNVGIQQRGIESPYPEVIRAARFDAIVAVLPDERRSAVTDAYAQFDASTPRFESVGRRFPAAADEEVYVLTGGTALVGTPAGDALVVALAESISSPPETNGEIEHGVAAVATVEAAPPGPSTGSAPGTDVGVAGGPTAQTTQRAIRVVQTEYEALGASIAGIQSAYILRTGGTMLLLTLVSVTATILVGYCTARTSAGVGRDIRRALFTTVEGFSFAEMDRFSTASLITRSTNDITQIQHVTMMSRMIFYAPIMGIGGIIRAIGKASDMWWIIAMAVGILIVTVSIVFVVAIPRFKRIQGFVDRLNLVARENLSGMMVIRAFTRQEHERRRFEKANRDLTENLLFVTRIMVAMMPLMMLVMNLVSVLVLWVGAQEVAASQLQVGDMLAFMQYAMQIFFSFMMMSFMFIIVPRASVSAERIAEVLATEPSVVDPPSPAPLPQPLRGTIVFKGVGFRYPGAAAEVLRDIDIVIRPGTTTAIIGTTGSGKSTLVGLIPRFYDHTAGSITIDGVDIAALRQRDLRSMIGFVPQKNTLLSGSVRSNLLYAKPDATEEEMSEALRVAQALDFVLEDEHRLDMPISQGGTNVSGGQRQRLSIARALMKRSPVYIFDDSFSALDYRTDMRLRRALKGYVAASAVIVVTQRVATIRHADQIVALDEGRVVGLGTHEELMEGCEVYRDIALSQLKQEEIA